MIRIKFPFKLISKDNDKVHNRYGRPFLSRKFKDWEALVKTEALRRYQGQPLEGNVRIKIIAFFSTKVHCDNTNLYKCCCDALQGILFKNDRQIRYSECLIMPAIEDYFIVEVDYFF